LPFSELCGGVTRKRLAIGVPERLQRLGNPGAGALARRGVRPQIVCRTAGNETVLSMVRAGMGSAVLPQLAVHIADVGSDASLCVHELKP